MPDAGDERLMLDAMLDHGRATLLAKCAGLTPEQLAMRSAPPSTLSLLGLVRHLAMVERWWFRQNLLGADLPTLYWRDDDEDAEFNDADPAGAEEAFTAFAREVEAARAAVADHDLDEVFPSISRGRPLSVRWLYLHMIEEYARHNGHADLLRERIDGSTGE